MTYSRRRQAIRRAHFPSRSLSHVPPDLAYANAHSRRYRLVSAHRLSYCNRQRRRDGIRHDQRRSCDRLGTKRIIFVTNGDDPFWDACLSGLKEGEKQFELADAGLTVAARREQRHGRRADRQAPPVCHAGRHRRRRHLGHSGRQPGHRRGDEEAADEGRQDHHRRWRREPRTVSRRPHLLHRHRQHRRRPARWARRPRPCWRPRERKQAATCSSPASPTTTTPAAA